MRFLSVTISGFLSVQDEITIPFANNGLYLVLGSNGKGKSTYYTESLTWALFGEPIRSVGVDQVINKHCAGAKVTLALEMDGETYELSRFRTRNKPQLVTLINVKDNVDILYGNSLEERQKALEKFVGMDRRTFLNSIVFGQGVQSFFASSDISDSDRKAIFDRLFGFEMFDDAGKLVSNDLNLVKQDKARVFESIRNLGGEVQAAQDSTIELLNKNETLGRDIADKEDKLKYLETQVTLVNDSLALIEAECAELRQNVETIKNAEVDGSEDKKSLVQLKTECKQAIDKLRLELDGHKLHKNRTSDAIDSLKAMMSGICPTCKQPTKVPADVPEKIKSKELTRTELISAIADKQQAIEAIEQDVAELDRLIQEASAPELAKMKKVLAASTQAEEREQEKQTIFRALSEVKTKVAVAIAEVQMMKKDLSTLDSRILALREKKNVATAQLQKAQSELDAIEEKTASLIFLQEAFGSKGIKAFVIESVLPEFNKSVNEFLLEFSDKNIQVEITAVTQHKKGTQSERMSVNVLNQQGAETYYGNSGGEKRRIDLAILMAFQSLASKRANQPVLFSVYDEVFDALDSEGIAKVIEYLRKVSQSIPVYLISHNDIVRALVDDVISV